MVRVVGVAADGRALAGDADLDGAPVCSYVTAYLRGRVIPSRGRRGVIFFWHRLRTPALSRRTGARVASWVLLGPWRRRARFSGAGTRVKQCLALWKAKLVRRPWSVGDCTMNRCWPNTNTGNAKLAAAGTLWHVTHALISESLPLLFVSSSGFSEPQAVSRSVVHERGRELERARRLSAARLASGLRH